MGAVACDCANGILDKTFSLRQGEDDVVAIVVPRLHDSAEDAVLTYGLSYFLNAICPTGQQRGIFLLMSILDVVSCDVASRAYELVFVLGFRIVSRSTGIAVGNHTHRYVSM